MLATIAVAALLAPWIAPFDPAAQLDIVALKNAAPSTAHLLGTDPYSRDILSRALFGARTSLAVATIATTIAVVIGSLWGAGAASLSGRMGDVMMSTVDVLRSVPRILLFLGAVVLFGALSRLGLAIVLGLSAWTGIARLVYILVREQRVRPYIEAAHSLGVSSSRVLGRHIVPQLISPLGASGVLLLADMLALESGLSFIGIGIRPPSPSWGNMVQDALPYLRSAWWLAAVPCALLVTTVLCAASLADHLAENRSHDSARRSRHSEGISELGGQIR